MNAVTEMMARAFPVNATDLRDGIEKLRLLRDDPGSNWVLSSAQAKAVLNALVRFEAVVAEAARV